MSQVGSRSNWALGFVWRIIPAAATLTLVGSCPYPMHMGSIGPTSFVILCFSLYSSLSVFNVSWLMTQPICVKNLATPLFLSSLILMLKLLRENYLIFFYLNTIFQIFLYKTLIKEMCIFRKSNATNTNYFTIFLQTANVTLAFSK